MKRKIVGKQKMKMRKKNVHTRRSSKRKTSQLMLRTTDYATSKDDLVELTADEYVDEMMEVFPEWKSDEHVVQLRQQLKQEGVK